MVGTGAMVALLTALRALLSPMTKLGETPSSPTRRSRVWKTVARPPTRLLTLPSTSAGGNITFCRTLEEPGNSACAVMAVGAKGDVGSPGASERAAVAGILAVGARSVARSEEHTSELQSLAYLVCRLLLEKKKI